MIFFRYLYTCYIGIVFFIFALVGLLFYFIVDKLPFSKARRTKYMIGYNRFWVVNWGRLCGVSLHVQQANKINKETAYVYVANHTAMSDALIACAAIPSAFSPLAKIEIAKMPVMGYLFQKVSVMVDRADKDSRRQSVAKMRENAQEGISVLVFPEGTRNKKGDIPLKPFYNGAFKVAIELQMPIAPFVLIGTRNLLTNDKLPAKPCTITAIFANPLDTKGLTLDDVPALREKTHQIMEQLLLENDPMYKKT